MQGPLILDRYRPIEVKGEGGSGKVELCWDTRIKRRVAIKRMPLSHSTADGRIPGLAEARTGAMLNRPSIVSVYDFDANEDEAFLIMEAIEGPSLSEILADTPAGTFDLDIAAAILIAIGDAIEFAHENQVLHLDIKPANILITRSGACKISDFGVSELADAQGFGRASGGTIGYMPPEQMRGEDLDERCDEFALASVAYEILTGRRPFAAKSLDASLKLISKFDIAPPSTVRGDLDPGIDCVFYTALSPNKEERYASVADFLDALAPYLGNPAQGSLRLREIAADDDYEDVEQAPVERTSLLERIPARLPQILGHLIAAALCWWVSASALFNVTQLTTETAMLIALLPAVGGAVKPTYGGFIALLVNAVVLFVGAHTAPVLGIIAAVASIAWVALFGREGIADANCALAISPLATFGFSPLAPMLAGAFLPPRRAFGAAVIQAILMLSIGENTGPELLFGTITSMSTWIIILGWIASAVLMSQLCSRETRILSIVGTIAASAVILAAHSIAAWTITGAFAGPSSTWAIATVISCLVMCAIDVFRTSEGYKGE